MDNEELEIFNERRRGKMKKQTEKHQHFTSEDMKYHNNCSDNSYVEPSSNSPKDSYEKKSALEIVLDNLMGEYHFINCNRQLYVYIYEEGYWKLIPSSNSNYELRSLIPADTKSMAMRVNFTALYDWLLSEAEVVGEEYFPDNWKYINFRDCAVNWRNGKIKTNRKKI